ncbi:MAG: phosphodiester glycosidase family protein [Acidimicrobiales bacterium]
MDPELLRAEMFAGSQEPGGGPWPYAAPIPSNLRTSLVAAFNSGFKLSDAHGGYYAYGKLAQPLVNGGASLVIYKNGTVTVGTWGSEVRMTPQVAAVRQNLTLIIDHGRTVPGLATSNFDQWGATVDNQVLVWRSGVGVTANGALLYAAGNGLSVSSLANVLVHAGAVRAMEMDINYEWTDFFSFAPAPGQPASPANGTRLVPDMDQPPSRYLGPSTRDFIAMFAR